MRSTKPVLIVSLTALLVGGMAVPAKAAPPKCVEEPATIHGQSGTIEGTPGKDVIVGSNGADVIKGLGGNDIICGKRGHDRIFGGPGADLLEGGYGEDLLDGGTSTPDGHDSVVYLFSPRFVKANLSSGKAVTSGEIDTIENVQVIFGSDFEDVLTGDSGKNFLYGQNGDDSLFGLGNEDLLGGGGGNDIHSGGSAKDSLQGGSGDDTASFRGSPAGVQVNLATDAVTGGWGNDFVTDIENVAGSDFTDQLTGDGQPNQLFGFKGTDKILGGPNNDLIDGGADDDLMFGGDGLDTLIGGEHGAGGDTVSYEDAQGAVTANLSTGQANPDGWGSSDQLIEVENLVGSYGVVNFTGDDRNNKLTACNHSDIVNGLAGDDTIYGGLEADTIDGGPGNDIINGENGDDTIRGGTENDTLIGGFGDDYLDGQDGTDGANGGADLDSCFAENVSNCENDQENLVGALRPK